MSSYRILIVEDEVLIADNIKRYLTRKGHQVVGMAISYDEAVELFSQQLPDICLLDIKLSGHKSGIDVAHFIEQQPHNCPFIYLTSQMDAQTIEMAKATLPAGYLSKPIHKEGLFATLEIDMHKQQMSEEKKPSIPLFDGTQTHLVELKDILFLQSDHIYLQVYLSAGSWPMKSLRALRWMICRPSER
ncbi:MAG: response regulator, partial [Bacteroidota bacterium]